MKIGNEFKAGAFLLAALVLFVVSVWMLGQERKIFEPQVEYYTQFPDVQGLTEGAPVRLGGITIGRVARIGFLKDTPEPVVEVALLVSSDYAHRIRKDSVAAIETQGLLGDKFLAISAGKEPEPLPAGALLKGTTPANMAEVLEKAGRIVNNTMNIAENVDRLLQEFRAQTFSNLSASAANVAAISERIKTGPGTLHDVIYSDEKGGKLFANLDAASDDLKHVTHELKTGKGLLHALIYDRRGKQSVEQISAAAAALARTADEISALAGEVRGGQGLLHQAIYEKSPSFKKVLEQLAQVVANLKQASDALAKGSGTLGALLIDSRLYDNLVEVTDDAKRSIILRHAIRSSLEEGKKTEAPPAKAPPTTVPETSKTPSRHSGVLLQE